LLKEGRRVEAKMRKYEFYIFSPATRSLTLKKRRGKKRKNENWFSLQSRKIMMKKEKFKKRERERESFMLKG